MKKAAIYLVIILLIEACIHLAMCSGLRLWLEPEGSIFLAIVGLIPGIVTALIVVPLLTHGSPKRLAFGLAALILLTALITTTAYAVGFVGAIT